MMNKSNYNPDGSVEPNALMKHIQNKTSELESLANRAGIKEKHRLRYQAKADALHDLAQDILNYRI
jgi:short-subunit dehydrogenase involved in D-alanine esterification of teichoic acids